MQNLKKKLRQNLNKAEKIALLGIGSELRGDDAAGILIAQELKKKKLKNLKIFIGQTAPENLTGEIKRYHPGHIILVDCANFNCKAGEIRILSKEEIGGVSFSTHVLPATILIAYLYDALKCGTTIIGIQPKSIHFGAEVSTPVRKAVKQVVNLIENVVADLSA